MVTSVVIENNGKEEWTILKDNPDYMKLSPEEMKEKIKAPVSSEWEGRLFRPW